MSVRALSRVEHRMVELKARVDDLDTVRKKLISLEAQYVGTFRQTDVYFDVPQGRLKLREVEGSNEAELIYYERENIAGPIRDNPFILEVRDPTLFKTLLERLLKTRVTVEKVREIYRYRGIRVSSKYPHVQIHLDNVEKLGTFIEFEMESSEKTEKRDKQILRDLLRKLEVNENQLEKYSYSDVLRSI